MIAYMLTWTTYGAWLQGNEGGYIKDGKKCDPSPGLYHRNQMSLKQPPVLLSDVQREQVKTQIISEAERIGQKIHALTVQEKHVHLVLEKTSEKIEAAVHRYKRTATHVLRQNGFEGKVWASGYDKRFCFTREQLAMRVEYVRGHDMEGAD